MDGETDNFSGCQAILASQSVLVGLAFDLLADGAYDLHPQKLIN